MKEVPFKRLPDGPHPIPRKEGDPPPRVNPACLEYRINGIPFWLRHGLPPYDEVERLLTMYEELLAERDGLRALCDELQKRKAKREAANVAETAPG